ncbi:MAG: SDR family NAD(P)-dependent oxidoreductase [Ferrovibrionaceae bacterium]
MSRLQDKVAVITGGSSGIGLAAARRFVEEGAYVFITGRRGDELDRAATAIGRNVTAVKGDVADLDDIDRLYREVAAHRGRVDVLFANAGVVENQPIDTVTPDHFDRLFGINVRGLVFTVQKALPLMQAGGSIILNASVAGVKAVPNHGVYSATKAAVRSFARTWTAELSGRGIRVNSLSPGATETPIMRGLAGTPQEVEAMKASFTQVIPMGRLGRPEEQADAALFLASAESSYITGIDLQVDGGFAQI